MKVAKDLVVSLAYQVRTEDGVLVDESPVSAPLDYLHGPRFPDFRPGNCAGRS